MTGPRVRRAGADRHDSTRNRVGGRGQTRRTERPDHDKRGETGEG
jgi:hypothetical protein